MKKMICGLLVTAAALWGTTAQAADGKVHFKGELKGLKDSLIVFTPNGNDFKRDTVLTPNGKFDFTVTVSEPTTIIAYTPGTVRRTERMGFQAIAVPGETAEMSGYLNSNYYFFNYYFSGSTFYQQYNEAVRALEVYTKKIQDYMRSFYARIDAGESRDSVSKEYDEKMPTMQKEMNDAVLAFIRQHPTYEASAALIPQLEDVNLMKQGVALLAANVREGRMKPLYQGVIDRAEAHAKAEQEAPAKHASGVEAPDFTLNDINGKPLKLSSLRGKYVLLDFWGSWCIWCIKGFPQMKEYYEKYKGKYEILGIDCSDTQEKWKDAVKKHGLPWLHVYNSRDSKVLDDYGVQGFPTQILVGPDGKIVKTIVGEDPSFYTFMDETFGK